MSTWEHVEINGHSKIYRIPTSDSSLLEFSDKDISNYVSIIVYVLILNLNIKYENGNVFMELVNENLFI